MIKKITLCALAAMVLSLALLWQQMPRWLPYAAGFWLPQNTRLVVGQPLRWHDGGLSMDDVRLDAATCTLLDLGPAGLTRRDGGWRLTIARLALNSECLAQLPAAPGDAPLSLQTLQQRLPRGAVTIERLSIAPWQTYAGRLHVQNDADRQQLDYRGERINLHAEIVGRRLTLSDLRLNGDDGRPLLRLSGGLALADSFDRWPQQGEMRGYIETDYAPRPLTATLRWQDNQGGLTLHEQGNEQPLATLPWAISRQSVTVAGGSWRWPHAGLPLSGGVAIRLDNWRAGLEQTQIEARLNVLTQGHNGKANAVLTLGPGRASLIDSDLNFRLTGQANQASTSMAASVPGVLRGSLLNPQVALLPGAFVRAWGDVSPTLRLDEARWPLAGIRITPAGVNGRLQAIVRAHDSYWGRFKLHLDGGARDFWPDRGEWRWKYWGSGQLPPLRARWDVAGRGRWQDTLVEVTELSSGFDRLYYGMVTVRAPRLTLRQPLRWQRAAAGGEFSAGLNLQAERVNLSSGGYLPAPELQLQLNGRAPDDFLWRGQLQAEAIGPVTLNGRWADQRLRGAGWWPAQPLTVFQPLLSPNLGLTLREGRFHAQAAFSAARGQGFSAGGHWVVQDGGLWLQDGEMKGVNFTLPYRLRDHRWQLGVRRPVTLHIAELNNLFSIRDIRAALQGYYPVSERYPLTLSGVDMDIMRGHISLSALRWPQRQPAVLRVDGVELSELFTALKLKPLAMSGRVSGELPLNFNHPTWLVQNGWIRNDGFLTLRLDQQLAGALAGKNLASASAVDWLRYLEIDGSDASVALNNPGDLTLSAHIEGESPRQNTRRQIVLNYRHQENIFQLWRSLRFGPTLQDKIEQRVNRQPEER
ncbi:YdbH family protein [Affinibrenneria salicis]|uniref:YdbH family protein n=1 Tax=Affinibrenneria salicis TaxID=2590031 RepID=A0A5J5G4M7_9GAMM|nr:YdbH family protein [Affinibrenneria salicis]KAA9001980.1 YdbH family protein [Affinibrenneria salicis]